MQLNKFEKTLVRCANIDLLIGLRLDFYSAPSGNNLHVQGSRTVFEQQAVVERAERDELYNMLRRIKHDFGLAWQKLTRTERNFVEFFYWQGNRVAGASDAQMARWRKKIVRKIKPLLLVIEASFAYYSAYQSAFERAQEEERGVVVGRQNYRSKYAAVSEQRFDELDKRAAAGVSGSSD